MRKLFTNLPKLSNQQLRFIVSMLACVVVLLLVGFSISSGMLTSELAKHHIIIVPTTQSGCVFHCNNTAYSMEALYPMQGGAIVSGAVLPGSAINWIWNAGTYGANTFTPACVGAWSGSNYMCTVAINTPDTNFAAECGGPVCTGGYTNFCVGKGGCSLVCNGWSYLPCGNADDIYGHTTYGASGGYPPNYAYPGYDGNTYGTLVMNAPSTPGTYPYFFCSNFLLHFSGGPLSCLETDITVANPAANCSMTPATQTINQAQNASISYSTNYANSVSYSVDGVNKGAPSGNPFSIAGSSLSIGAHPIGMNVTGTGGNGSCSASVAVIAAPLPTCSLNPATQTVQVGNNASFTYTTTNAVSTTYKVDGGSAQTASGGAFSVSGLALGNHNVIMTVTNPTGSATCGTSNNVSVVPVPLPTVSLTANPTTVNPGATSTLTWSDSGATAGQCSLTAPSSSATATNFGSITSGNPGVVAASEYITSGGYLYQYGGNNGSAWITQANKVAVGADLTTSGAVWTPLGNMPASVPQLSVPININGTIYIFGGYNAGTYVNTICSIPATSLPGLTTAANWDCSTSLPAGGAIYGAEPVVIGDYIYKVGGYNGTSVINSFERAPVSSPRTWTNFPGDLPAAFEWTMPAVVGNYAYFFGGLNSSGAAVNSIWRIALTADPTTLANWQSAGVLPTTLWGGDVVYDANYLYIIGGQNGSVPVNSIYRIPLGTLAAGGITAGSWVLAGSAGWSTAIPLPVAIEPFSPAVLQDDKLYIMGGQSAGGYINKIYKIPFNDSFAYTTPTTPLWAQTVTTNSAVTWPINAASVTYTLQCTNAGGTSQATATINEPDLCTNVPFSGIQNPLPSGVTAVGTTCSCTASGTFWNGSSCAVPLPPTSMTVTPTFNGSIAAVTRVQKGKAVQLNWNVSGLNVGDNSTSCSVSSNPAGAMITQTWDHLTVPWTQGAIPPTVTINGTTVFTLSCTNSNFGTVTKTATVGVLPTTIEQ